MPFIPKIERENPDTTKPGSKCFLHYKFLVEEWNKEPRWTTADRLYAWVTDLNQPDLDWQRAKELAWQVFFQLYVMPYEFQKMKDNGRI